MSVTKVYELSSYHDSPVPTPCVQAVASTGGPAV